MPSQLFGVNYLCLKFDLYSGEHSKKVTFCLPLGGEYSKKVTFHLPFGGEYSKKVTFRLPFRGEYSKKVTFRLPFGGEYSKKSHFSSPFWRNFTTPADTRSMPAADAASNGGASGRVSLNLKTTGTCAEKQH